MGKLGSENMLINRSLDLSEVCTEKALKKSPPPLQLLGAESWQVALFPSLMTQDLCLGILPFLSAKDVEKFGCVHSTTQKFVQQFLNMRGKCMLIEVRMLIDISDILRNVTDKLVRVYHEDFFKAVWASTMVTVLYRVLLTKHNKIMTGKEEGTTAPGNFQNEDSSYVVLNLMPQLPHSVKAYMKCMPSIT